MIKIENLDSEVNNLASQLSNLAPNTMQMGLSAYNKQDSMSFEEALPFLQKQIAECVQSDDAKEGINAFLEKRE